MHAEEGSGGASILSGPGVPAVRRWIPPTARDVAHISVHLGAGAMKGSPGRRGRKATGRSPRFFGFFFGPIFLPATLELVAAQGLAKSRTKNGGEEARRETLPEAALSISRSAAKAGGDCILHLQSTRACGSFHLRVKFEAGRPARGCFIPYLPTSIYFL